MNDWCAKLKLKLEECFSMPFDVSTSRVDGEEQFVCCPSNDEARFFVVKAYIHDQIRLVVDVNPQKSAREMLCVMENAERHKRNLFFQYIDVLTKEKAKVLFRVNDELVSEQSSWPKNWRYFNCRITLLPIPEVRDEDGLMNLLFEWMTHGITLFLSLLTIDEQASEMEQIIQQEGNAREIMSIRYERSRINREICLAHKGYSCSVCGFNFLNTYGQLGKDFIEVHHTTPVSEMGNGYVIDIDRDLVPVCSNCHSMIHRRKPPFSVEELKAMMETNINGNGSSERKKRRSNIAEEKRLIPQGSMLEDVEADDDVRRLVHNMMELYEGTTIMNIVAACQREFQERYFSMKTNDWRHLLRDYVRKATERPTLQENEVFRHVMAG